MHNMPVVSLSPDTDNILALYRRLARPWLDLIFEPATCTEQSRVLFEVLKRFGIAAEPVGTKMHVICEAREYQFVTGLDEEEKRRGKRIVKAWIDRPAKGQCDSITRHVVLLVERRILVDSTLHQASAPPEFSFVIAPDLVILPFPNEVGEGCGFDVRAQGLAQGGIEFEARWIATQDRDWELDEGWEPSHLWPLIDRLTVDIRAALRAQAAVTN